MIARARPRHANGCVSSMGLSFSGPLGVAAGVDRNGEKIASLDLTGFGHIEIGTITAVETLKIGLRPENLRIGVSFGSSREGIDEIVVADYSAALRQVYREADYLCANLTSPRCGRDGNSRDVDILLQKLKAERDHCAAQTGRRAPLLIKIDGGEDGDSLPKAVLEARRQDLDGIVLVCASVRRIAAIKYHVGPMTLISVGGVRTRRQADERMSAGAALVQAHKAFVDGGFGDLHPMGESAACLTANNFGLSWPR
jgi:dihydroorotate dehydrogenase